MKNTMAKFTLLLLPVWLAAEGFAKPVRPEKLDVNEVHVVGIYEGEARFNGVIGGPRAFVQVNRPGKKVVLVLCAYDGTTWEVSASKDTQITKIYLGGYHRQAVEGQPKDVPVVEAFYEGNKTPLRLPATYRADSERLRPLVKAIHRETKMDIASFQGTYRATERFVVDRIQDDERLRHDYPRPTSASLPQLEFNAYHAVALNRHEQELSYGLWTLQGPKESTLKPLPASLRAFLPTPVQGKHYGIDSQGLVEVDLIRRTTTQIKVGLEVPRLSWPRTVVYDEKEKRLFVLAQFLYSYAPSTGKWAVVAETGRLNPIALTYHPKEHALYVLGLTRAGDDSTLAALYRLNKQGAVLKSIPLNPPVLPGMFQQHGLGMSPQLMPVGDYIVLLTHARSHDGLEASAQTETFLYLIDPKTEKVLLTWRK